MATPITCPTGCAGALPAVLNNPCAIECCFAQISEIYLSTVGNPLADPSDATEWTSRLEDTLTDDPTYIRTLVGIGSRNTPTFTTIDLPKCLKKYSDKEFSITFNIVDLNDEIFDLHRYICECNAQFELIGFGDVKGKHIFSFLQSTVASVTSEHIMSDDKDSLQSIQLTLTWEKNEACRYLKPF